MQEVSPHEARSFLIHRLRRGLMAAACGFALAGVIFLVSRYASHRHLQTLVKPQRPNQSDLSLQWQRPFSGPAYDWIERWIGSAHTEALFCSPVGLTVQESRQEFQAPDATVIAVLNECRGLKTVRFHNRDASDRWLEIMVKRHAIEELSLRLPVIDRRAAMWLSRMPRLKRISLGQFERESRHNDWSWLQRLPDLQLLEVSLWGTSDEDVIALAQCSASTELRLSGEQMSDQALDRLCDLPALKNLSVGGSTVRFQFPAGRKLPSTLESLHLDWTDCDDDSLALISGLPQLQLVSIMGGRVTNAGLETIAGLPSLKQLWLHNLDHVTDDGLKALVANTSLQEIVIRQCRFTPQALVHLTAIPNCVTVRFNDVSFDRKPGSPPITLTPETAEEYMASRRRLQENFHDFHEGPSPLVPQLPLLPGLDAN